MKIDATIQARLGSERLPGKVLKPIIGKPMLQWQIERIQQSRLIDRVIIATTDNAFDDDIEALARQLDVPCFRGSEDDVLGRVVGALKEFDVDLHVEFQGDNPMPDPLLVDSIIGYYLKNADQYDYVTNALKTTYPPGFEVSVYPSRVLYEAEKLSVDSDLREHVGLHIYQRTDLFRIYNMEAPGWLNEPDLHVEVDTEEDFSVVSQIFEHFLPENPGFSISQVIEYARIHDLARHNQGVERRWRAYREEDG